MNALKRLFSMSILLFLCTLFVCAKSLPLDQWAYIQIDDNRGKWGDWDEPEWLRYFGLDFQDVNRDGYVDIISGRYFYRNPGGTMEEPWTRVDLGVNVDGCLFVNVDGDDFADIIAAALPEVFWFEAEDLQGSAWTGRKIGQLPPTGHNNGQGYAVADLISGGKQEIILQADKGIYVCEIPANTTTGEWPWHMIITSGSDEGIGVGDLDGDGDFDLAFGDIKEGEQEHPTILDWAENPGFLTVTWKRHSIGETMHAIDRVEIADMNGDDRPDVIVSEERYPGQEPDGHLWWFEARADGAWERHQVVQQYSMNNLDVGDIDNDGDIDIVTNMHKGESLATQVWENNGTGEFTKHVVDTGKEMHLGAQLIDIDNDGDLDIVGHAWDNYQFLHLWRNDAIKK
ncbi:VCBS repeat-containing protein [candidate division KSB1 bacterium]|nr:VCBS repeat-containing protein [candidate division KSB1 bacterium]